VKETVTIELEEWVLEALKKRAVSEKKSLGDTIKSMLLDEIARDGEE